MMTLRNSLPLMMLAFSATLLFGCNTKSHIGGDDSGADGGGDGGGEVCGPTTCGAGEVCCNASCGICVAPGGSCIEIACTDGGLPDGSTDGGGGEPCGSVTCGAGEVCCSESCGICTPPGGDCPAIECLDGGMPITCGGFAGVDCPAGFYCDFVEGCGFADDSGECMPMPDACTDDCPGVCGCDGVDYCNACGAAVAGTDVLHSGPCGDPPPPPPLCTPTDAYGVGACALFLGYVWNGTECEGIGGCSCGGTECDMIFSERSACEAAHRGCFGPRPEP